jgi:CDP-diglyceride synthetase
MPGVNKQQAEKRNLLSSFFITVLIGIAYQEMIAPVRESVRASGITLGTSILMAVFFLTGIRFWLMCSHCASYGMMAA